MRRGSFDSPFKSLPSPYISCCNNFAFAHSFNKISKHNYHTCYQNPGTNCCDLVIDSIFRKIIIISSWHSKPAHDKHWEIECIEPDKYYPEGNLGYFQIIHPSKHFRKPIMKGCEYPHACTAKHYIVEVSHNKGSVGEVNVDRQCALNKSCKSTYREEENKGKGKEHRGFERDGALIESGSPIEYLNCTGNSNNKSKE